MQISREYDSIYNDLLVAHLNKAGVNANTIMRIIYSGVALLGWGLYKVLQYVANMHFPDTSDYEWLQKHAKARGLPLIAGEEADDLLARINEDVQYPRAGGNAVDWLIWMREVSYVHDEGLSTEWTETVLDAVMHEGARGSGSLNVIITSDRSEAGYEEIATAELVSAAEVKAETKRALGLWNYEVIAAARKEVDIEMAITAENYSVVAAAVSSQLEAYLKTVRPRNGISLAMISSIATVAGATNVAITTPAADVTVDDGPDDYERVWPGTITVSEI